MMPFLHRLVGDVGVVVTVAGRPTEAELDEHLREAVEMLKSTRVGLIISGGDLTSGERSKMARAGLFRPKTAVVTHSMIALAQRPEIEKQIAEMKKQLTSQHPHDEIEAHVPLGDAVRRIKVAVDARMGRIRGRSGTEGSDGT